ncbi:MAG: AAA family ATPase [FCB group bacterium]|nr:AAA family ATPase [FCB group bacterium]
MKIAFTDIQNFRKLKNCRIVLSEQKTIFVGANNSGKTSAMDALIIFLKYNHREFSVRDFTLSNWKDINQIASDWVDAENGNEPDLSPDIWRPLMPSLDVWLEVKDKEVHYVSHIIPTLDWAGGKLGIRLVLEPNNTEELYKAFKAAHGSAKETCGAADSSLKLWPKSMRDFLEKELHKYFTINAYILDPSKAAKHEPQPLTNRAEHLDGDPFKGLFKIDIINAQRGFSDPKSADGPSSDQRLSAQLIGYFEKHLNPSELPDASDLDALQAIETARDEFNKKLRESFRSSIGELENLNYPGFSDPEIVIACEVDPLQGLTHDAAVQFNVRRDGAGSSDISLCLPEKYNGLGYQNLISMVFNLIRFRDEWMRVGKAAKRISDDDTFIEPLHIVLIEEPEAHLHAQVQQVFIKKAYDVLRNHPDLDDKNYLSTQLIISTHSSHIAHEIDFVSLRYFKRVPANDVNDVPGAVVVNLSTVFGSNNDTTKFATRYLKTTHCDLFFADAAILVEGPAERMLVPDFISNHHRGLDRCYISLLEIGGSHAHRLRPLIERLGLMTLVITDLDSIKKDSTEKVLPKKGEGYRSGNDTIKSWVPEKANLDEVLNIDNQGKVKEEIVRVAYQCEMTLIFDGEAVTAIPYTFEDAVVLSNVEFFKGKTDSKGLIKKMAEAVNLPTIQEASEAMFDVLGKTGKKAEMALELLYMTEPGDLNPPQYIAEGLQWLEKNLTNRHADYIVQDDAAGEGDG